MRRRRRPGWPPRPSAPGRRRNAAKAAWTTRRPAATSPLVAPLTGRHQRASAGTLGPALPRAGDSRAPSTRALRAPSHCHPWGVSIIMDTYKQWSCSS